MTLNKYLRTGFKLVPGLGASLLIALVIIGSGCGDAAGTSNAENATTGPEEPEVVKTGEPENVGSIPEGYNGPLQGKVISKEPAKFEKTDDLKGSIEKATLGQLVLEYSASENTEAKSIELPKSAMDALNEYFRKKLEHRLVESKTEPGTNDYAQRDVDLMSNASKIETRLHQIEIDAPDGKRRISQEEASRLIRFVSETGTELGSPPRRGA
ncbi:MAG: hypothetical protein OEM82_00565 [Acidobacteriota bacterium]|nr:hypothetical protein [Acidobacteriota bacterium]MDH3529382.1 hypothetical protein [Acidobacteriota bacterium]